MSQYVRNSIFPRRIVRNCVRLVPGLFVCVATVMRGQQPARPDSTVTAVGDSIKLRFIDVELRVLVEALGQYLSRPLVIAGLPQARVTLQTPNAVSRTMVPDLIRSVLEGQGAELRLDSTGVYRASARQGQDARRDGSTQPLAGTNGLTVIRLRHARALDVASTVSALYGRASIIGEVGTGRSSTLSQQIRNVQTPPPANQNDSNAPVRNQSTGFSGDVTIVPDQVTNSLMIRATNADLQLIRTAIEQLDIRPLQVLIEVLIVEVRKDKSLTFGVDASVPPTRVPGSKNTTVSGSTAGVGLADFVLRVMGAGGVDIDVALRAAATNGSARVVSRPVLMATNNEVARILVGSQRPFVQVQRTLPTDNTARDQVVQYRDVGTELSVRPTVSADGYVTLEVTQQVNSATAEMAFDAPIISTRSIETKLVVRDTQTIVLGGLSDHQRDVSQGGIPILSSIPILGGLFGRRSNHSSETELLLFLKPRVIRTDADVDSLTAPLRDRMKGWPHD